MSFADLLRTHRRRAGLSQERLAESAGISAKAVGALESGRRRAPYRATVVSLGRALGLNDSDRAAFDASAARARLPSVSSQSIRLDNLPSPVTSFVGRERELEDLSRLLKQHRLLTITGTGGLGKTRLALAAAFNNKDVYTGGVWLVEFASVSDAQSVFAKIGTAIGLTVADGDPLERIATQLADREVLLVLDNCEHVLIHVVRAVEAIMRSCPRVSVLATSRERIALTGEVTYRVSSLPVPPMRDHFSAAEARAHASVQLFIDRAQMADPRFEFSDVSAAAVADICREVEGIPLAVEIAAARLPYFGGLSGLRRKLDDRLDPLTNAFVDSPARQRTLQTVLEWSFGLLNISERALLRRQSVFRGSYTVQAARAVCAGTDLEVPAVESLLISLVDKSLIAVEDDGEDLRYASLASTREFAAEKLRDADEEMATSDRLIEWAAAFADGMRNDRYRVSDQQWNAKATAEFDNVHAAFVAALDHDRNLFAAGRILGGVRMIWDKIGRGEALRIADYVLSRLSRDRHQIVLSDLYLLKGFLSTGSDRIRGLLTARDLMTESRDAVGLVLCYFLLTRYYLTTIADQTSTASRALGYAWTFASLAGLVNPHFTAFISYYRAGILERDRLFGQARELFYAGAEAAKSAGDNVLEVRMRGPLAEMHFCEGDVLSALSIFEELMDNASDYLEARSLQTYVYFKIAACLTFLGDLEGARQSAEAGLRRADGFVVFMLNGIEALAHIECLLGDAAYAARLVGCADNRRLIESMPREAFEQTCHDALMIHLRTQLNEERLQLHQIEGKRLNLEDAIAELLSP